MTSLFRKMLIAYISVIIVAFGVLTFAVHFEVRHFLAAQKLQVLRQEAQDILAIVERVNGNPKLYPEYDNVVSRYKRIDNASVNLLLVRSSNLKQIERLTNQLVSHTDILNRQAVARVLSGQTVELIGPFSVSERQSTLIVGMPITEGGAIIGALFLHTPVQELQMRQITMITLLIASPILLLSILILYLATRRFSTPLVQMSRAVQAFGEGDFSKRIDVESQDEVAQLALAFNDMANRLERLEKMRKDLIANVSHEIRTPLTSVRGFIQGILDGVVPQSEEKHVLRIAHTELNRLSTLLNTMLDLSAIETGNVTIESEPVLWSDIVNGIKEQMGLRAANKGLQLNIAADSSVHEESLKIWGDKDRLTQVLFNLVDNAIRHTKSGKITITSSVEDNKLKVQVEDTGEGIPSDVLPHIWDRFYTASSARTSGESRSGLGLTITKHLVERMNGRMDVHSTPGVGSVFTVWFPVFSA